MAEHMADAEPGSWTETVRQLHFHDMVFAGAAVLIASVELRDASVASEWFPINGALSVLMFLVAVEYLHSYGRSEPLHAPLWDRVIGSSSQRVQRLDRMLEGTLIFAIIALPFSTVSVLSFGLCLALLCIVEAIYAHMASRLLVGDGWEGLPPLPVTVADRYASALRIRLREFLTVGALGLGLASVTLLVPQSAWIHAIVIVVIAGVALLGESRSFEALRDARSMSDQRPTLRKPEGHETDQLTLLYHDSFLPDQRIDTAEALFSGTRGTVYVVDLAGSVVGFVVLQVEQPYSFLWYMGVGTPYRSRGLGAEVLSILHEMLAANGSRLLYLESRAPVAGSPQFGDDVRRLRFYRAHGLRPATSKAYLLSGPDGRHPYVPLYQPLGSADVDGDDISDGFGMLVRLGGAETAPAD